MRLPDVLLLALTALAVTVGDVSASVFMPYGSKLASANGRSVSLPSRNSRNGAQDLQDDLQTVARRMRRATSTNAAAMAIPGYGLAEQVFVGGFSNFLSIYNLVITARILLSWFPQAAGVGFLQPVYQITDPYLNLFRGIIPPIFGLDLSPILAFVLLNLLSSATAAVGAELTPDMKKKQKAAVSPMQKIVREQQRRQEPVPTLGSI